MADFNNLKIISELINFTNSVNNSIEPNELIRISNTIHAIKIDLHNISCILKLIANLVKFEFVINSDNSCFDFNIPKLINTALDKIVKYDLKPNLRKTEFNFSTSQTIAFLCHSDTDELYTEHDDSEKLSKPIHKLIHKKKKCIRWKCNISRKYFVF